MHPRPLSARSRTPLPSRCLSLTRLALYGAQQTTAGGARPTSDPCTAHHPRTTAPLCKTPAKHLPSEPTRASGAREQCGVGGATQGILGVPAGRIQRWVCPVPGEGVPSALGVGRGWVQASASIRSEGSGGASGTVMSAPEAYQGRARPLGCEGRSANVAASHPLSRPRELVCA